MQPPAISPLAETDLLVKLGVTLGACYITLWTQKKCELEAFTVRNASCSKPVVSSAGSDCRYPLPT